MLQSSRVHEGVWEGHWQGDLSALTVLHAGRPLPGLSVQALEEGWALRLPIPVALLSEGVQAFVIRSGPEVVGGFAIGAGAVLDEDLRAEVALLRAELELLKQVVRRLG